MWSQTLPLALLTWCKLFSEKWPLFRSPKRTRKHWALLPILDVVSLCLDCCLHSRHLSHLSKYIQNYISNWWTSTLNFDSDLWSLTFTLTSDRELWSVGQGFICLQTALSDYPLSSFQQPFCYVSGKYIFFISPKGRGLGRVAKPPQTYKPGLEGGFGQQMRKILLAVLRYPSAGKVGINWWIASLRLRPPWY